MTAPGATGSTRERADIRRTLDPLVMSPLRVLERTDDAFVSNIVTRALLLAGDDVANELDVESDLHVGDSKMRPLR